MNTKKEEVVSSLEATVEKKQTQSQTPIVSRDKLLEAGAYFGHKKQMRHPKMKEFIVPKRLNKNAHIIDIVKTQKYLEFAYSLVEKLAAKGVSFIFVGTKRQAKKTVKEAAERTNSLYVSERWLGGTLTNNSVIMKRVQKMNELDKKAEQGFKGYTKKEALLLQKQLDKLHQNLDGIKNMRRLPQVMIVTDLVEDKIAIQEAKKKKIKIIGIVDTNVDPTVIDFGIPANDDSSKSINLIVNILADAIAKTQGKKQMYAYQPDDKIVLSNPHELKKIWRSIWS